jgi:hypothetical protein
VQNTRSTRPCSSTTTVRLISQRATHEYVGAGTSCLYAALILTTGKVIWSMHAQQAFEFKIPADLDREVPADLDLHVVLDNACTHKTPAIDALADANSRSVLRFTRPVVPGSTSSNAGSGNWPPRNCNAAPTTASANSTKTSAAGSGP